MNRKFKSEDLNLNHPSSMNRLSNQGIHHQANIYSRCFVDALERNYFQTMSESSTLLILLHTLWLLQYLSRISNLGLLIFPSFFRTSHAEFPPFVHHVHWNNRKIHLGLDCRLGGFTPKTHEPQMGCFARRCWLGRIDFVGDFCKWKGILSKWTCTIYVW